MEIKLHFFLLLLAGLNFASSNNEDVKLTFLEGHKCYLSDIEFLNPTNCSDVEDGGFTVANRGHCLVEITSDQNEDTGSVYVLTCNNGHWSGTDSSVGGLLQRRKRFFGFIVGAIIGCALFCGGGGGGSSGGGGGNTKYPPSFPDPCKPMGVQDNYNVRAGESGAHVSWPEPVASDRNGGTPSVIQVGGGTNGGLFEGATYGKPHYITYKATDSDGLTGHCHFDFTVTLLTCNILPWPANGARICENNNILGSSCYFTCHPGYQLSGNGTVTCENDLAPTWSHIPTCEKIECSSPSHPVDSTLQCSDLTYPYQSICSLHCNDGFSLEGQLYMQCRADGTWSNDGLSTCADDSPPTITCITPQIFYADRGATSTSVTWKDPTAQDSTDPHPTIVKTDGPSMGEVLEVGSEVVRYKAVDSDGNESPECFIELRVEEIACAHPVDSLNDNYLVFSCTSYIYGASCNLSCLVHLPLEGASVITCEDNGNAKGVWDWGAGDQPYCREIACPELGPPINGALVYDTILTRPMYTMMCNDLFDIPDMGSNFNGVFFCTDKGRWTPFDNVPDCIGTRDPRFLNLPAELFYYSGDCGTEETMAQIEDQFQVILAEYLNPYLESVCPAGETCTAENIVINCGPIKNRTKRAISWEDGIRQFREQKDNFGGNRREHSVQKRQTETHLLIIEFNIVNVLNLDNTTLRDAMTKYDNIQLNILKPAIQELVNNGTFDVDGFVLRNDSFQTAAYGDIKCEAGYELDQTECKPCPLGYSWSNTRCEQCPVGQYKDIESEISCSDCPAGFSTKKTGSKSQSDCIKLCNPGSYSPDTVESCSPCLHGYYQNEYGQTTCKVCPGGTTTEKTNSSSVADCKSYDVFLENTNGDVTVTTLSATMTSVTFTFWSKRFDDQQSDVTLRLTNDAADLINVYLNENIRVEIPSQVDQIVGRHGSSVWNHVTITWDTMNSRVTVYVGGVSVYIKEAATAPNIPLIENGAFVVQSSGPTGVYLTGLHLLAKVLPESDIGNHSASCYVTESDDIINLDAFRDIDGQGISIMTSSQCDAVNKCLLSPCNGHPCTNGRNNFTCTCLDGWSGPTCTVPPDYCISNICENGAACQNGNSNYTCSCMPGYSGQFCEVPPVDGGWSEWNLWTGCSQSCGSGTKFRTRQCDSPLPDTYGKDCVGNYTEVTSCDLEDCPVCEELERNSGTLLNCTTDYISSRVTCVLYCEEDRFMPPGLREFQTYTCGPDTNYAWDSLGNLPSCVGPVGPRNVNITVSLDYTSTIYDSSKPSVMDAVNDNLAVTPCHSSPNCQTELVITSNDSTAGSTISVTFGIPLLHGPNIQYDAYVSNGTVSDALQELEDAIVNLESTANYIRNYTVEVFDVTTNGVTLTSVPNSLKLDAILICNSGYASLDAFCLRCPSGTYSGNGVCNFCDKGTYQELVGQTSCTKCPLGMTTTTIGSIIMSQCTEEEVSTSSSSTITSTTSSSSSSTITAPASSSSRSISAEPASSSSTIEPRTSGSSSSTTKPTTSISSSTTVEPTTFSTSSTITESISSGSSTITEPTASISSSNTTVTITSGSSSAFTESTTSGSSSTITEPKTSITEPTFSSSNSTIAETNTSSGSSAIAEPTSASSSSTITQHLSSSSSSSVTERTFPSSSSTVTQPTYSGSSNSITKPTFFSSSSTISQPTSSASSSSFTEPTFSSSSRTVPEPTTSSSSSTIAEPTTSIPGHIEDKKTVYIAIAVAILALIVAVAAIGIVVKYRMLRSNSRHPGAAINNIVEKRCGNPRKYKKSGHGDTMLQTPTSTLSILSTLAVSDGYMNSSDDAKTLDISISVLDSQLYLTPSHNPDTTEKDDNAYNSIYAQIDDSPPVI